VGLVDQSRVGIQKRLIEHPVLGDWAYRLIAKPLFEACLLLDQDSKQTGKDAKDKASAIDKLTDDFLKSIIETACFEESMRWALTKLIADGATVTDDVDGAWTAEDDQEITFLKQVQHRLAVSDQLMRTVDYERSFAEKAFVVMGFIFAFQKARAERVTFIDSPTQAIEKPHHELLQWVDQIAQAMSRRLSESSTAFDRNAKQLDKTSAEPLAIHEVRITSLSKQAGDATQLSDFAAVKPAKGFGDAASFIDQIVRSIGFIRAFDDMGEITDTLARSPTKLGADSSFVSDRARRQTEKMSGEQALVIDASRRDALRRMLDRASIVDISVRFLERRVPIDCAEAEDLMVRATGGFRTDELRLGDRLQNGLGSSLANRGVALDQLTKHGNVLRMDGVAWFDRREMASSKRSSDAVVMTDSGFWDQQSYAVDPAFFAADYVGKRQYF
jgi:hypothetical protein